jgi:hypothetical protein
MNKNIGESVLQQIKAKILDDKKMSVDEHLEVLELCEELLPACETKEKTGKFLEGFIKIYPQLTRMVLDIKMDD